MNREVLRSKRLDLRYIRIKDIVFDITQDEAVHAYNQLKDYYLQEAFRPKRLSSSEINKQLEFLMNTFEQTLGGKENGKSDRN